MEYLIERQEPGWSARIGSLALPEGKLMLPAASCAVRTRVDVAAVGANLAHGMPLRVVTPYASYGSALGTQLGTIIHPAPTLAMISPPQPLVLADPEAEAFSFHTVAQDNYKRTNPTPTASVDLLLSTGLGGVNQVHATWRKVLASNGPAPVAEWLMHRMAAVRSDVFVVVTPIIRLDPGTVDQAFEVAHNLVREARSVGQATFTKFGVELLVHSEILKGLTSARIRGQITRHVQAWARDPRMGDLFLSLKVYDHNSILNDSDTGTTARRSLGSLVRDLSRAIRLSGGALTVHNVGTWILAYLYDGSDIVTFRVTGPRKIDTPARGRSGPFEPPSLLIPRSLIEMPPDEIQRVYQLQGAYPKPDCVESCEQYWAYTSMTEQRLFCARQRTGVLTELSEQFRAAAMDRAVPLEESVDNLISEARIKQQLTDLIETPSGPE